MALPFLHLSIFAHRYPYLGTSKTIKLKIIIFSKIKTKKLLFLLFLFSIFVFAINSSFFFFRGKTWEPRVNRGLSRNCERHRIIPARILSHRHNIREGRACGGAKSGDRLRKQFERQGAFAKKAHLSPQRPPSDNTAGRHFVRFYLSFHNTGTIT